MSYDVSIKVPGPDGLETLAVVGNYTCNVWPMWREVIAPQPQGGKYDGDGDPDPGKEGLPALSGLEVEQAAELLHLAAVDMVRKRALLEPLNPANGWGDHESAMRFLLDCFVECFVVAVKHPRAVFCVNW